MSSHRSGVFGSWRSVLVGHLRRYVASYDTELGFVDGRFPLSPSCPLSINHAFLVQFRFAGQGHC